MKYRLEFVADFSLEWLTEWSFVLASFLFLLPVLSKCVHALWDGGSSCSIQVSISKAIRECDVYIRALGTFLRVYICNCLWFRLVRGGSLWFQETDTSLICSSGKRIYYKDIHWLTPWTWPFSRSLSGPCGLFHCVFCCSLFYSLLSTDWILWLTHNFPSLINLTSTYLSAPPSVSITLSCSSEHSVAQSLLFRIKVPKWCRLLWILIPVSYPEWMLLEHRGEVCFLCHSILTMPSTE